ncbi:MAG: Demethylmenaquinone methyltransferase [Verrucomicrobia subdivision 3 bacterium]|nr:Demethylmenaquinone methyltransferase [Limisphaerales bacterium]MCS1413040.1 Demethylmenaquinone methyltransferase [Limisphaerales bacterium]
MEEAPSLREVDGWISRVCPGCGGHRSQAMWHKGDLHVGRCLQCDIFYVNPVEADLASGKFYDRLGVHFYLSPDKRESDYAPIRFKREIGYFRQWCQGGAILDIGCSTGAFLFRLGEFGGYEGVGMDVSGPALDYGESKGVKVIRGSFLSHEFGDQRFDAVTFWAVVEHLTDPLPFLRKAATVLKRGGFCFVLVPNRESLATRILGVKYRYVMPDHVNYFSRRTLIEFVERVPGLEVVSGTTMKFNPIVILQDLRRREARIPDVDRAKLLKKTTGWKHSWWLAPLRWLYNGTEALLGRCGLADNLVVVARKRF